MVFQYVVVFNVPERVELNTVDMPLFPRTESCALHLFRFYQHIIQLHPISHSRIITQNAETLAIG